MWLDLDNFSNRIPAVTIHGQQPRQAMVPPMNVLSRFIHSLFLRLLGQYPPICDSRKISDAWAPESRPRKPRPGIGVPASSRPAPMPKSKPSRPTRPPPSRGSGRRGGQGISHTLAQFLRRVPGPSPARRKRGQVQSRRCRARHRRRGQRAVGHRVLAPYARLLLRPPMIIFSWYPNRVAGWPGRRRAATAHTSPSWPG